MKTVSLPVSYKSPLVNQYLTGFSALAHLFEYNPHDFSSFEARYQDVTRDYRTDRTQLVTVLTAYNRRLRCGPATLANLAKLEEAGTVAVISGQQAGVLTGPMYTLFKTVSILQLAREVKRKTGFETVPIFWVASEDHDFAEINHLHLLGRDQKPVRLKLDFEPPGKLSIGRIPVDHAVLDLIEALDAATNPSEWKDDMVGQLKDFARQAESLAEWFALTMAWLFRDTGLIMVDPMLPELRRMWSGTFADFLDRHPEVNEQLQKGIERVQALGYEAQVEKEPENTHMFMYVDGERLPLVRAGDGGFAVRGRPEIWSRAEMQETARQRPQALSPNVVLRPVAQDVLLPILAYVAGPGEISYFSLYRDIYRLFGQRMPLIYPRANVTLVEKSVAKNMERYRVDFGEGLIGLQARLQALLDEADQVGIDQVFAQFGHRLEKDFRELAERVAVIDPELTVQGNESLSKIMHQLENFQKKTRQYHRRSCDTLIRRFTVLENSLFPHGNWQERIYNVFPFLFKHGPGLLDELIETPLLQDFHHKLAFLGE